MVSSHERILVVDDVLDLAQGLLMLLNAFGYDNVVTAENGVVALGKLECEPFHLVITDYNMPHMDGLELIERIRANKSIAKTPVILLSGEMSKDIEDRAARLSVGTCFTKPVDPNSLLETLTRIFRP